MILLIIYLVVIFGICLANVNFFANITTIDTVKINNGDQNEKDKLEKVKKMKSRLKILNWILFGMTLVLIIYLIFDRYTKLKNKNETHQLLKSYVNTTLNNKCKNSQTCELNIENASDAKSFYACNQMVNQISTSNKNPKLKQDFNTLLEKSFKKNKSIVDKDVINFCKQLSR